MIRKNYTDNDVILAVKTSKSLAQVMVKIGLKPVGGNYYTMKRKIQILGIDTSHFTGQLWSKGSMLKDWTSYSRSINFKKHLIEERGNICENCYLSEWMEKPIKLEIHHVDGNRANNVLENLELLCPNCHSFTDTWKKAK